MLLLNNETLKELTEFTDIKEMDDTVRNHRNNNDLTDTEWEVLSLIARHSCKYVGVSYLSKNKIAEQVGKSRRTIIRVCNRLESLGIITQHEARRVSGDRRQTSNIVVIQPIKEAGKPAKKEDDTPEVSRQETQKPIKQLNNNTTNTDTAYVPAQALKASLPAEIYEAFARYFNADDIYEYYGILLRAKRRIKYDLLIEEYPDIFVDTIHASVLALKKGKVRNFANYLYGAFQSATAATVRKLAHMDGRSHAPNLANIFA